MALLLEAASTRLDWKWKFCLLVAAAEAHPVQSGVAGSGPFLSVVWDELDAV